jgi:protein-S-isoprenylcysteine O-methyltransferase Ste14
MVVSIVADIQTASVVVGAAVGMGESAEKHGGSLRDYLESIILGVSLILEVVFAVVFYNHLGFTVLEYCGFVLVGLSLAIGWLARIEFTKKGCVPEGKSYINTTVLVKSGIYAVVRHPMYTSGIVLFFALTLISQHWLSVVFGAMPVAFFYVDAWEEDKSLVVKFGEDYRRYVHEVPRVNIIIGVFRLFQRRH